MRLVLINPKQDFMNTEELLQLASAADLEAARLHFVHLPVLPVLVDAAGIPLDIPNQFLASLAVRSLSATGDTARTYAEGLLSWLTFINVHQLTLADGTEEWLALFRNHLANCIDQHGGKRYSSSTINSRIAAVESFYAWADKRNLIPSHLGNFLNLRRLEHRGSFAAHPNRWRKSSDSLRMRTIHKMPRVLSFEELSRLFAISRQPFKLMFRWAVSTGLRRFEICNLHKSKLPSSMQIANSDMNLVPIDIMRKGGKTITIYAPAALVEETHWYFMTERPAAASPIYSDFIFLNKNGVPYSRNNLSRTFRKYADSIESKATLHHLRHTFATLVLGILESKNNPQNPINSIKSVQILLGHANVTTTEIYLRALEVTSDEVKGALDFLYGATL